MLMERKGLVKYPLDGDEKGAKKLRSLLSPELLLNPEGAGLPGTKAMGQHR
jgi:hypothetical protein